jgi:acyl carrier protein
MENSQKLYAILAKIFRIPAESIIDDTSQENTKNWDSMNALLLVAELETIFKVKFTMAEVASTKSVGEIKTLLAKHGITL